MHITQAEKEKFLASLDEDAFRELIIRRLFKSLGFKDGRDLCGPEEFGKDAVFIEVDKFGDESVIAVQTKRGAITMAGDPSKNLHTILAQLRTALNQPHICVRTKVKRLPAVVYLAASGVINAAARSHIQSDLTDPRVKFLDRDDLISKVDDTCPEIWSGIASEISPYLKSLADRVDELSVTMQDENHAQSSFGAFAAASDRSFIDLTLGHQELFLERRNGRVTEDFRFHEIRGSQLFRGDSVRALVLGEAGSGKTTLMIRLAYMLAKSAVLSTKTYKVPVFIRAHELIGITGTPFQCLSDIVVKNHTLQALPFDIEDFAAGRVVLLVDGLDELFEDEDRQSTINFCLNFAAEYPKCSLALTTRPYSSVDRLAGLDKFKRYRISPLSMDDASRMLKRIDDGGEPSLDWRRETLRKLEGIHGVELNPLLVTVFAVSTRVDKGDIPANITELFAKFTEMMLGRWDEKKGLDQQYQSKVKDALLSDFAFKLHQRGDSSFQRQEFVDFATARLTEINLSANIQTFVTEILDRSGLLRGEIELEFRHHLLQEYFAARGIPSVEFVRKFIGDDWWRNSIVFYFGNSPKNVEQLLDVATSNEFDRAETFVAVGLALQACYMSRIDEKIEVWKWVNSAAGNRLERINSTSTVEKYPLSVFLNEYLEGRDALALSGIQDGKFDLIDWCHSEANGEEKELRNFWYAAGLIELGEFGLLRKLLADDPIKDPMLLLGVHFGCFFAQEVKSISADQKVHLLELTTRLAPLVETFRHRITDEFKGQLLEYRRGGVIALDEPEAR